MGGPSDRPWEVEYPSLQTDDPEFLPADHMQRRSANGWGPIQGCRPEGNRSLRSVSDPSNVQYRVQIGGVAPPR